MFLVMGESLPFYWRGLQLPWYWDISPLAEVEDFCVRDASGRCSPVAGARQKRRLRAGDAQLYGHSRGQFAVRSVGGFFKLTLLNFSLRISLFLIHFGMITNISSSNILIFDPGQQDFWLFSCFPHQGVKASSRTACHFLAQNRQF